MVAQEALVHTPGHITQVIRINRVTLSADFPGEEREQRLHILIERTTLKYDWNSLVYVWDVSGQPCPDFLRNLYLLFHEKGWVASSLKYGGEVRSELNHIPSHFFEMRMSLELCNGGDFAFWFDESLRLAEVEPLRKQFESIHYEVVFYYEGEEIRPEQALTLKHFRSSV